MEGKWWWDWESGYDNYSEIIYNYMKRKYILVLLVIAATLVWFGNNYTQLLWNANTVSVSTDNSLTPEKVKIEFGISVNTINRENDLDLFKNRDKYTIVFDGEEEDCVANEYGENDFLVTYDDKYYLSFRQFKTNWRSSHDYGFYLFMRNDSVFVRTEITGKNGMAFERVMLKIEDAAKYRCNVPVDSAGYIYNMIELVPNK